MCAEVNQTITGAKIDPPYYQCLANAEADCLEAETVSINLEQQYLWAEYHEVMYFFKRP